MRRSGSGFVGPRPPYPGERMVVLSTGQEVSNYSEAYRLECEATHLLTAMRLQARRDYLALVLTKRGEAAHDQLRTALLSVHAARQAQPATTAP